MSNMFLYLTNKDEGGGDSAFINLSFCLNRQEQGMGDGDRTIVFVSTAQYISAVQSSMVSPACASICIQVPWNPSDIGS